MIRKNLIITILLPILLLLISDGGQAQMIKEFHRNKNDYFIDITTVLQYSSNRSYVKKGEDLLESFSAYWESGYFKPQHREKIYDVSNIMLTKTMRSYPHYYQFISSLVLCVENGMDAQSLDNWLTELDTLGKRRSITALPEFLEYSHNLFENKMLYESRSRAWYFRNGDFTIERDSIMYLAFMETDLICSTNKDSMEIIKTRGKYYVQHEIWDGERGKISWRRAGYHEDTVYVELRYYDIDLKRLSFNADSATFYNKKFFNFPVVGYFTEKVLSSPPGKRASYPRFDSYTYEHVIDAFYENVNCIGGLGMQGRKLVCKGDGQDTYAKFIFEKGGEYFAVVRSSLFEVEDDEIVGAPASFSIYFENDSIYHPGLQMRYDHKTHLLSLIRLNRGTAQSPFFNAFHNVNMYAEALYWVMNSEEISFEVIRGLSPESRAGFESDRYYSAFEYYKLQGIDETNPLNLIKNYAKTYGSKTVKVGALAEYINKPIEQAVAMLLLLESKGFVVYNSDKREAMIKQRLYDYLLAHTGDSDYDVFHFDSHTRHQNNAEVELATFDMLIKGVPEIFLSDSQRVYIYPTGQQIVMQKNKNFNFSGKVRAGLFEFYAKDCSFEYEAFKINLPQIDSMSFFVRVPDPNARGRKEKLVRIRAVVENMNGYILIDDPDNKSGLKTYPQYPIFTSLDNSFVYYDKARGIEGIYKREDVYYELDPFTIDSLDNFAVSSLRFKGYLSTGGILPNLEDELVVQSDYSLGVNSFTDPEGLPLYEGKARFYDTIRMDNAGLHGAGQMNYLTSVTHSSSMHFYPDSVISTTRTFKINKLFSDVEFADVDAGVMDQIWFPDSNLMVVNMLKDPFTMYDKTSKMRGSLFLRPSGLTGTGDFTFERAVIESEDFTFGHHSMGANKSDFRLYADTTFTELAFLTDDYRTDLDFDQRQGKFISSGVSSLVDMPFNQYICYMDEIYWDMDAQMMRLQNNIVEDNPAINDLSKAELINLNLQGSDFISTHPQQDSLRFFSTKANYDLQTNVIYAEDVKIIRVADAGIFPGDGTLTIQKDAKIETLQFAEIITDTATKYHHVYDANVDIYTRHKYAASGTIDYLDVYDEKQPIELAAISVDSAGRSYATGGLEETAGFNLSPWFSYAGEVRMESRNEFLNFDGSYTIEQNCFPSYSYRIKMDTLIDPNNILIPVPDTIRGLEDEIMLASLMYSPDLEKFYPAFFTRPEFEEDLSVVSARGYLSYDKGNETFRISDTTYNPENPYLALHGGNCFLEGVGPINLDMMLPHVTFDMYGQAGHYIISDSTLLDIVVGFDFYFEPNILRKISRNLNAANLSGVEGFAPKFRNFMKQRISENDADKIVSDLSTFGTTKRLPVDLIHSFLFSKIKLGWSKSSSSFVSMGEIEVFSIGEELVNKLVPAYVEIIRKPTGFGEIYLYFEIPGGHWYYFSYRNNVLQTISSDEGYNADILSMKDDKRMNYTKDEPFPFEYIISSKRKMVDFKRRIEEIYGLNPQ